MDDDSGLADRSNRFASFLTLNRKFGYHCFYTFYIISPGKKIWKK